MLAAQDPDRVSLNVSVWRTRRPSLFFQSGFRLAGNQESIRDAEEIQQTGNIEKSGAKIANHAGHIRPRGFENRREKVEKASTDFCNMVQKAKNIAAFE